ncbi:MAG: hypothetical protein H0T46_02530 [Deltaproteobacteria bacterium]|nr:hypothetical protein [Deltaproteobacteria bacterium]
MRIRLLATFLIAIAACGGDDVNHLADAPLPPDAAPDAMGAVPLSVTNAGTGAGTVTSSPAGITCTSATCSAEFDPDTVITLTAVADTGSVFTSWGGACSGSVPTCEVTLAQAATVTATFDVASYAVTVTKAGNGTGTIAGNGITCGATCTVMVDHGTMISLTQTPANLSVFAGWGGACTGTAGCMVTVTGPTTISANFALDNLTLFVTKGGTGAGTVTATGINCGADCSESYTANQMVTLTAAASTGSTFAGWSGGGCTGTGTCIVTMNAAITVTATFTLQQFALTVAKAGNGSGNVTSNPAGIACGVDCTQNYNYNTMVTLTAAPSTGSTFTGWTGACTGTAPCNVTMTAARNVTATFTLMTFTLSVTKSGDGAGTVTGNGVNCGGTCTVTVNYGSVVSLSSAASAAPSTLSSFTGWSGSGCTGTGGCTFTITANSTVNAAYKLRPNLMFTTGATFDGNLGGLLGADRNCQAAAAGRGLPGTYRAYLGATGVNARSRIAPATGWTRVDGRVMFNRIGDFGTTTLPYPPSLDEAGNDLSNAMQPRVWTATAADTQYYGLNCNNSNTAPDWSTTAGRTMTGVLTATDADVLVGGSVASCGTPVHLYCFGIDRTATVP